jgi:TetR/AcrR family transcriptional regulator
LARRAIGSITMTTTRALNAIKKRPPVASAAAGKATPRKSRITRDPERSRHNLIKAATAEFSTRGFEGARVDDIAVRAGSSKQLVYHYFKSKDDLYIAVLEDAYERLAESRARGLPDLSMKPEKAIITFVSVIFDSFLALPDVIALIADENFHKAVHVRRSSKIKSVQGRLEGYVREMLVRGRDAGVFRDGIDPLRLFISILGLCSFYVSNRYTLSAIYQRDLTDPNEAELWRKHIIDFVRNALQPTQRK